MSEPVRMSVEDREKLNAIVREKGFTAAAKDLEVHEQTLVRALGGFGVRRTTITHLRVKLGDSRPQL